jgi:hypothetical protein
MNPTAPKPVPKPAPKPAARKPAPKPAPKAVVYDLAYLHTVLAHYLIVLRDPFGQDYLVGNGDGETVVISGFPETHLKRTDEWQPFDAPLMIGGVAYPVVNP